MQLKLVVLAALQGLAAAQSTIFNQVFCITNSGPVSRRTVPRTTLTETIALTFRTTVCPAVRTSTSTVTPAPVTVTGTTTVTVFRANTITSVTATVTDVETGAAVTVTNVVTVRSTFTSVSTSTVTETTTPTQTVPPPPGFTALSEEPDYVAKKKRSLAGRIPVPDKRALSRRQSNSAGRASRRLYPQNVRCVNIIETTRVITVTLRTCSSTATVTVTRPASTSTVSRTVTNFVPTTVVVSTATTITVTENPTVTVQSPVTTVLEFLASPARLYLI